MNKNLYACKIYLKLAILSKDNETHIKKYIDLMGSLTTTQQQQILNDNVIKGELYIIDKYNL